MRILKEGYLFIVLPLVLGLMVFIIGGSRFSVAVGILFILVSLFCIYFFRDPQIEVTKGKNLVISPCNGTVLDVSENEKEKVVRVFLSLLDVHLQRSPIEGKVVGVEYKRGKFLLAMKEQAHIVNEQNIITIENENGKYFVKQIAGVLARRCVSWVKSGDVLEQGDKIGMIKFSSQVDLHMPKTVNIKVKRGNKVRAGITVFATYNNN
ncbi:MAG: phosphatidylserine decarboxylase [Endomicrobium sp.]|jgi:phosphatidylserine decarboxylase|nr:phosphatidylserine decarboxylase [Endomicrobium sp.]